MQTIYSTLGKQLEQSSLASNKQGIQGGENKVDGRNSDQGHIDSKKNEDAMKWIQNEVDNNNEEMLNQDKDVAVSENSDIEKAEGKYRQINEVVVSQELDGGGDKKKCKFGQYYGSRGNTGHYRQYPMWKCRYNSRNAENLY